MCVALPGKVIEIVDEDNAIVKAEVAGDVKQISAAIVRDQGEDVAIGDWLEIHMGHALAKLKEDEAREMLEWFDELDAAHRRAFDDPDQAPGAPEDGDERNSWPGGEQDTQG